MLEEPSLKGRRGRRTKQVQHQTSSLIQQEAAVKNNWQNQGDKAERKQAKYRVGKYKTSRTWETNKERERPFTREEQRRARV